MQTLLLFIQDVILAAIAYFLYLGVFIPIIKKNAFFAKLNAKEKAEVERKLGIQEYFGESINEVVKK